jgi:hypothetical protein
MGKAARKIHNWVIKTKLAPEKVIRKVVLDLSAQVVLMSPVDTGRFRANWMIGEGSPNLSVVGNYDTSGLGKKTGKGFSGGVSVNSGETTKIAALNITGDQSVFITNSLPYAARLEYGWSKQAPEGMVRKTVAKFLGITAEAVAFVKRGEGI